MKKKTYTIAENLVDVSIHSYTCMSGTISRRHKAVPVAQRLKSVVDQLDSVAFLGGSVRITNVTI